MIKQKFLFFAAFVVLGSTQAIGQAKLVEKVNPNGKDIVIPYEKYVLPNGLTLIVHEDHSDPVAHVDVTYHVGSAREQIGKSGFAHFFEHMMFEGSDHAPKGQHDKIIFGGGGSMNGTTNRDRTNYFETVPSNLLEKTLWLESDRMGFLLGQVSQPRFEIQRATVKNERGQRVDNVAYGLVSENFSKNLYPYGHPYSWEVIGYIEDLNRSDVNDLKNFFMRWYGPNNAVLTIGGDVKTAEVVKMVEKYFGSIPRGPEVKPVVLPAVQIGQTRYASYTDNYARNPLLIAVYPTVPNYHKDMAALQALAQVIGQGRTSVLFQQLTKKQLAVQASAFARFDELAGEFIFQLSPIMGKSLADMEKSFKAALDSFEATGVSDEDIQKFKSGRESQLINSLQSVQGKVSQLASFQTFTGNANKIADLLKAYSSLTKEDVMRVYNTYLKGKGSVVLSVVPKGQEALIAAANNYTIDSTKYVAPDYGYAGLTYTRPKDNFDRSKMPGNGANPQVKVPEFWKKELANGAKVIGAKNSEIPTVTLSISIPGGHLASAKDLSKAGLADFFTAMMLEDTKTHTAEQLTTELQKLGSSINVSSDVDEVTFSVQSLKKNLAKTLALLEERMFSPKFTSQSFDRLKKQSLQNFKNAKAQPANVANTVFAKLNYGPHHILGISQNGTEETIGNLKLEDIESYYNNYMTSLGAKVVIVGDITQQEILPMLSFLDKLPKKKITLTVPEAGKAVDKTKVFLVDIPKGAQTEFRVGYATGMKYDVNGEYYKSVLSNFTIGGGFNSRLNQTLREQKGWTYGASSRFAGDEYSGDWLFSSGVKGDVTDSALAEVMSQIKNFVANGPTDDEVAFMKNAIGQSDALRYETGMQKAQFIRRILDYNLPANYTAEQAKILKAITKQDIMANAKKNMNPEKFNILLVGDKQKILDGVKKLGYEIVEVDADGNVIDKKAF